jgi:hypothetical protein
MEMLPAARVLWRLTSFGGRVLQMHSREVSRPSSEDFPSKGEMARNLLVLACSDEIQGNIVITGHPGQGRVTLLGYKNWRRDADSRDLAAELLIRPTASDETQ